MIQIFQKRILVTFLHGATGELIGSEKIALADLPDSFLESTTMELGTDSWSVESADPPFKRLFSQSKKLTLRLRPIEMMDPQEILFSLPTISDDLALSEGAIADGSEAVLWEDDWRQVELISRELQMEIFQEFDDIKAIYQQVRRDIGFNEIHVRSRIPDPLGKSSLTLVDLEKVFGAPSTALRFENRGHRISEGLRCDLGGNWMLYGTAAGDRPRILAIASSAEMHTAPAPHLNEALNEICREHDLVLVDWCRCTMAEPDSVEFAATFAPVQE